MPKKNLFTITFVLFLTYSFGGLYSDLSRVYACPCTEEQSQEEAIKESDAIFEGVVTEIQPIGNTGQDAVGEQRNRVHFRVVRSWKGVSGEHITVFTAQRKEACGYEFSKDKSFLVYATSDESGLQVSSCGRTILVVDASDDIRALGIGEVPVDIQLPQQEKRVFQPVKKNAIRSNGCASCEIVGGDGSTTGRLSGFWAAAIVGSLLYRRLIR